MTGRRRAHPLKPFRAGEHPCSKCGGATSIHYARIGAVWIDKKRFEPTFPVRGESLLIVCQACGFVDAMACKDNNLEMM